MRPAVLISLCLMGIECRYDGGCNAIDPGRLGALCRLIPVCPEVFGGLPVPRIDSQRRGERVVTRDGADVTKEYETGAAEALRLAREHDVVFCVMKQGSPACGSKVIHDGTFSGTKVPGEGVAVQLLREAGYRVYGEEDIEEAARELAAIEQK